MAYRDWEKHLCERHVAPRLSGPPWFPPSLWRRSRHGQGIAALGQTDWQSRLSSRGHACVGLIRLQHQLNALHIMAALVRWGVPRPWALALARRWERVTHGWLYTAGP